MINNYHTRKMLAEKAIAILRETVDAHGFALMEVLFMLDTALLAMNHDSLVVMQAIAARNKLRAVMMDYCFKKPKEPKPEKTDG